LSSEQERELADIAETITSIAGERYALHERVRRGMISDFGDGTHDISSRVDLYSWWNYDPERDFADLSEQIKTRFGREISALSNKGEELISYLSARRKTHFELTEKIITHETRMNAIVYD